VLFLSVTLGAVPPFLLYALIVIRAFAAGVVLIASTF